MQMLPSDAKCITSRDGSTGYIFGGILNNTVTNALFVFNSTTSQVSRVNTRIKSMQYRNLSRCLSSCSNTACNYSVEQFNSSLWRERCQWQIFERFVVIPPIGQYMVTGIVTIICWFYSCFQRGSILLCVTTPVYVMRIPFILLEQREVSEKNLFWFIDMNSIDCLVCNILTMYEINLTTGDCTISLIFLCSNNPLSSFSNSLCYMFTFARSVFSLSSFRIYDNKF